MVIWRVEWVLKQLNICALQGPKCLVQKSQPVLWDIRLQTATYWLEIRVPKTTDCRANQPCTGSLGAKEIYNDQKLHTRGCKPAIGSQSFVDGVKEAEILVNGGLLPPDLKNIEAGIEQEGKFNHRVGIRWKQSDMKGVVLWPPFNLVSVICN